MCVVVKMVFPEGGHKFVVSDSVPGALTHAVEIVKADAEKEIFHCADCYYNDTWYGTATPKGLDRPLVARR